MFFYKRGRSYHAGYCTTSSALQVRGRSDGGMPGRHKRPLDHGNRHGLRVLQGAGATGTRTRDLRRDRTAFTLERGIEVRLCAFDDPSDVPSSKSSEGLQVASALQASGFRSDVTVFRLNARPRQKTGSLSAFRRNTAEHVYIIEAAHNPEVAGSNPAPATERPRVRGLFSWLAGWLRGLTPADPREPQR
jgi:hypothetical protein